MADKLAELKAALEGMSIDGLRLALRFAEFLLKEQKTKAGKKLELGPEPPSTD